MSDENTSSDAQQAPETTPELSSSPVNAESAASDANQKQQQQAAAEAVQTPAADAPRVEPISTSNKTFDEVGALLSESKYANVNTVLAEAAEGEISLKTRAEVLDVLGETLGTMVLGQLENEVGRIREAADKESQRLKEGAARALGGDADTAWETLQEFARSEQSGLSQEDRDAINRMLSQGGKAGEMAVNELVRVYQQSAGFTHVPALLGGDGGTGDGFKPLSKAEYVQEIAKVNYNSPEADALRRRRLVTMQRGFG